MPTVEFEKRRLPGRSVAPERLRVPRPADVNDPRWQLVERVAQSRSLGRSALLVDFLRYVCDRQLRGRDSEITEQQIGVKIFGRPEGYNSNDDNIVRNYARTLRKRIDDYFQKEGLDEPLILAIPRGGYIPMFSPRVLVIVPGSAPDTVRTTVEEATSFERPLLTPSHTASAHVEQAATQDAIDEPSSRDAVARRIRFAIILLLGLLSAGIFGYLAGRGRMPFFDLQSKDAQIGRQLWGRLFEENRDTFIVPADGGLVMMQSFTRQKVGLTEYVNGSYRSSIEIERGMQGLLKTLQPDDQSQLTHKVSVLAARRYTSIVDLDLAARLARLKEVVPERLVFRFARDLRIDDLRTGNAILIGSNDANPWVSLFEQQLNFQFSQGNEFGGSGAIINTHPLPGEQMQYASITGDPSNRTYGVIAYVANLSGTGHILLIEGVNMAGTQAAEDFLLSPERMRPMIEHALDARGKLQPFEILLETSSVAANASSSKVLSQRMQSERTN